MKDPRNTARQLIDADLRDAIRLVDDVTKLLPNAGLPVSAQLDAELRKARTALYAAQIIAADLT